MDSENDDWADALAAAVHDQRGYLSNIIVSLSLIKRRESFANDPKILEILSRVESGADGLVQTSAQLQLLAETGTGQNFTASGPSTVGTLLSNALKHLEKGSVPLPEVVGGDDETVVDVPPEAGGTMLAAVFEAANELAETAVTVQIRTSAGETSFVIELGPPKIAVRSAQTLFDGSWATIGKPARRSVPLGLFVARRAARKCGGELGAEKTESGLTFTLTLPHSDREPPRDIGWG